MASKPGGALAYQLIPVQKVLNSTAGIDEAQPYHSCSTLTEEGKQHGLLSCIPILRTFGINSQVDLQDVGAIEGLRHALDYYGLGQFSGLGRPFQYHFIMHLKYGAVSSSLLLGLNCVAFTQKG